MTPSRTMGVGIVGCGLIGKKRAAALGSAHLVACADALSERAEELAGKTPGCEALADARQVIAHPGVDIVVVATPNHLLAATARMAVEGGKHVLVEKPAARNATELKALIEAARKARRRIRVGFNHRYHQAFRKARELFDSGAIGPLMFVRGRYGHGGRVGYEKEWRADPALSGGGELIDQGVHLIDLSRWFLGDLDVRGGYAGTSFWNMPVDDNAFLLLQTKTRQTAFLHVSCTEWKNLFSFEIYGRFGKLHIEGLGGSYGVERLSFYRMLPGMGPPETTIWEYPRGDDSWEREFVEFLDDIRLDREPAAGLPDAVAALSIAETIYAISRED